MIAIKDVRTSCSIDHWFPTNHAPMSASLSGQSWAVTTLTWVTAWSIVSLHLIYSSICSCSWCSCASLEGPGVYKFNSHVYNYTYKKIIILNILTIITSQRHIQAYILLSNKLLLPVHFSSLFPLLFQPKMPASFPMS